MTIQEFKQRIKTKGFTREEMYRGIEIGDSIFTIDTCMGGRYWTVSKRTADGKWTTLCTRALFTTAINKVENELK